jgi:hypothetical protein
MTHEEIFDTVARHLLAQKKRSMGPNGQNQKCLYRGPDGLKCAIGCLIPDELYHKCFEGESIGRILNDDSSQVFPLSRKELRSMFAGVSTSFLNDLQELHDYVPSDSWSIKLRSLAARWHLMPTVFDEFA